MRNKAAFIELGRITYQALDARGVPPNGPSDLETPLATAMRVTSIFKKICASKAHAKSSLYPVFASSLTRFIIDTEWNEIIKKP